MSKADDRYVKNKKGIFLLKDALFCCPVRGNFLLFYFCKLLCKYNKYPYYQALYLVNESKLK